MNWRWGGGEDEEEEEEEERRWYSFKCGSSLLDGLLVGWFVCERVRASGGSSGQLRS